MINTQTSQAKHLQSEDLTAETLLEMYQKVAQLLEDHFLAIQEPLVTDLLALQGELQDAMREKLAKFPPQCFPAIAPELESDADMLARSRAHALERKRWLARVRAQRAATAGASQGYVEEMLFQAGRNGREA